MVTLNNILGVFEHIVTDHAQINSFGNGDLWEIAQSNKLSDFSYPLLWVKNESSQIRNNNLALRFSVFIMDLVHKDESNENEVLSDTLSIATDLISILEDVEFVGEPHCVVIDKDSGINLDSFTERFDDEVSGWRLDITIKQPFTWDRCSTPLISNFDCSGGTPVTTTCLDALVLNSDSSFSESVPSGDSLVLPDIEHTDSNGIKVTKPAQEPFVCTPQPPKVYLRTHPNVASQNHQIGDVGYHIQNNNFWVQHQGIAPVLDSSNILLLDSNILNNANAFGDYERFTNDLGGIVKDGSDGSTANYIIDHLTGKGYALRRGRTSQTWANAMNFALSDPHGPYDDFRSLSAQECIELFDDNTGALLLDLSVTSNFWLMNTITSTEALFFRKNQTLWSTSRKFTNRSTTSPSSVIGMAQVRNHY